MKHHENHDLIRLRHTLRWRLTLFVFAVMVVSGTLTAAVYVLLLLLFPKIPLVALLTANPLFLAVILLLVSASIGTALSAFLGKYHLRPIKMVSEATKEVKKGNFKVKIPDETLVAESEMGQLIRNFNEMVRELDGIELFRNDFINNFSHEFKTPIVSIRGFARELQQGDLSPAQRQEYAKIIAEESDRLAKLSINVLELSKLENQQIITDQSDFFLDEQLRQCILLHESAWTEKNIEIIPELDEVSFFGNEEILSHIWVNLIGNAIKFTPENGTVTVSLRANKDEVTVAIGDTGIGMSEDVKKHIFEKFYQGDESHGKTGYGIGLTMAHRAAVLSGGTIGVESTLGKGSVFTVHLPIKKANFTKRKPSA